MRTTLLACLFGLLSPLSAQTFVVDAANGPGTDFTSLAQATATVPSGSVLYVRAGSYWSFSIIGKSMKVLAAPGAVVFNPLVAGSTIHVSGLESSQTVLLQGLELASGFPGVWSTVVLNDNDGSVLLDGLRQGFSIHAKLDIRRCAGVQVSRHEAGGLLQCETLDSNISFEHSDLSVAGGSALMVDGGSVAIRDCSLHGGLFGGGAAIELLDAEARISGSSALTVWSANVACISGTGRVFYDPQTSFSGPTPFASNVVAVPQEIPVLRTQPGGGAVQATLSAASGSQMALGVIAIGLDMPPVRLPGIEGALWLDPSTMFFPAFGVLGGGQQVQVTLPWASGAVSAVRAVWQGAQLDLSGNLILSSPSLTILP